MKMWSLFSSNEIQELLSSAKERGYHFTVWQHSTQQFHQFTGRLLSFRDDSCEVAIKERVEDGMFIFEEPIYLHCHKLDFIFKREKFKFDTGELSFKAPSELMLKEKRRVERFRFLYQDFKFASFYTGEGEEKKKHSANLLDLSIAGMAFVGPAHEVKGFSEGDLINITHISDQELEGECVGEVRSVVRYEGTEGIKDRGHQNVNYRVSVEFKEAIESISIKSVKSIVERTQKRTRGLEIEGFNGLSHVEQLRTIKKIGEENKVLARQLLENVENLDRLRYLTNEMKQRFWMEVNQDLLAAALRLSSKELIYDLVGDLTERMQEDFLYKLDEPKSAAAIEKAQKKIVDFIYQKEREGVFVLSAQSFVKYV